VAQVLILPVQPCEGCSEFAEPSQEAMFWNGQRTGASTPDFPVNIPGFDSMNRAYIRDRMKDIHGIPGTLQRMRYGNWDRRWFDTAIKAHFRNDPSYQLSESPANICYSYAGGWYNAGIVFDRDDVAYTAVHARPSSSSCRHGDDGAYAVLLLYSTDYGENWQVLELSPMDKREVRFALERPHSPEPLESPPAVLLWSRGNERPPCEANKYGTFVMLKGFRCLRVSSFRTRRCTSIPTRAEELRF
jgi:hypothetical protein